MCRPYCSPPIDERALEIGMRGRTNDPLPSLSGFKSDDGKNDRAMVTHRGDATRPVRSAPRGNARSHRAFRPVRSWREPCGRRCRPAFSEDTHHASSADCFCRFGAGVRARPDGQRAESAPARHATRAAGAAAGSRAAGPGDAERAVPEGTGRAAERGSDDEDAHREDRRREGTEVHLHRHDRHLGRRARSGRPGDGDRVEGDRGVHGFGRQHDGDEDQGAEAEGVVGTSEIVFGATS